VLLSQALHTRNDLTELRQHHPALAARFAELRDMLDQPATTAPLLAAGASDGAPADPLAPARDRRRLARELATVLARIREQDGFATFGLPPHTRQLLEQATAGPVVLVNINSRRSDALLLTGGPAPCRATAGDRTGRIQACPRTEKRASKRSCPDQLPRVNDHRDVHG